MGDGTSLADIRARVLKNLQDQGLLDKGGKPTGNLPDKSKMEDFISKSRGMNPSLEQFTKDPAGIHADRAVKEISEIMTDDKFLAEKYGQGAVNLANKHLYELKIIANRDGMGAAEDYYDQVKDDLIRDKDTLGAAQVLDLKYSDYKRNGQHADDVSATSSSRDALIEKYGPIAVAVADATFDRFESAVEKVGYSEAKEALEKDIDKFSNSEREDSKSAAEILRSKLDTYKQPKPTGAKPSNEQDAEVALKAGGASQNQDAETVSMKVNEDPLSPTVIHEELDQGAAEKIARANIVGYLNLKGALGENTEKAIAHTTKVVEKLIESGDSTDAAAAKLIQDKIRPDVEAFNEQSEAGGPVAAPSV